MATGKKWSDEEVALVLAHPDKASGWEGWKELLPNRNANAIAAKRSKLGLRGCKRGPKPKPKAARPKVGARARRRGGALPASREPWTDAQRVELVRVATEAVDATGHDLRDCAIELAHIVMEYRDQKGESDG